MTTYYFLLGNTPKLSVLELELLTKEEITPISDHLFSLTTAEEIDISKLQNQAGGLVKTYQQLSQLETDSTSEIEGKVTAYLLQQTGKVIFSVSNLSSLDLPKVNLTNIKKELAANNIKSRYLESSKDGLHAAVLTHQKVHELVIIQENNKLYLAKTISIQDIDDWSKRDRSKPYADRKKGMLPPKVARIMVNLTKELSGLEDIKIYDPFCGSGTILMEGLVMGCEVTGSDLDPIAVSGTQDNLDWLIKEYDLNLKTPMVRRQDVSQLNNTLAKDKVDAIITEPFLGKPKPKEHELKNIFKGLYRTYLGAFKNWTQILRPNGMVVIIFPLVETKSHTYDLNKLIDKLSQLGYTTVSEPIVYSRPQAIVKRQLNFLRYKG